MSRKFASPIPGFIQLMALDHRAHRTVDDDDPLLKKLLELCVVSLHHRYTSIPLRRKSRVTILGQEAAKQGEDRLPGFLTRYNPADTMNHPTRSSGTLWPGAFHWHLASLVYLY